jgi:hypothetical protein
MESHWLILKDGPRDSEWQLEWDDAKLTLTAPDGKILLETEPAAVYQIVDLFEMYVEGRISMASPFGAITFRREHRAFPAMRELVETGLASDQEFCARLQQEALRGMAGGLSMFLVGSTLFGLYWWYTSGAPDPPWWIAWLIRAVLLILIAMALGGPYRCFVCFRQWLRIRRIVGSARAAHPGA